MLKLVPLLLILCWSGILRSQAVTTTAGSLALCSGETTIPITVTGFTGVGAFSMALIVNPAILEYTGYQDINVELIGGAFIANEENGIIYLSWYGYAASTISDGSVLVKLVFTGNAGSSSLNWDTQTPGNCEYSDINGQFIPSNWINGTATIYQPPLVTVNPTDKLIYTGSNTTFQVTATGTSLQYLWQVSEDDGSTWSDLTNGGYYSTVTTATLHISNTPLIFNGFLYRCKVSGTCSPVVYSVQALLTVTPYINTTCQSVTYCPGEIVVPVNVSNFIGVGAFSMVLNINSPNLTYTGYQNLNPGLPPDNLIINISGGIMYIIWYETTGVTLPDGALFELKFNALPGTGSLAWDINTPGNCEYSDVNGVIFFSNWVNSIIAVNQPPIITGHPLNRVIANGNTTTFSVTATGTSLTYLWQLSTDAGITWFDLSNGGHYSNVTAANLTVSTVPLDYNNNLYRCRVTGTCPPVAFSDAAMLTVTPLIITTCQSLTSCPGEISVPVTVTDFIGVGAFSMALPYNPSILNYTGYQDFNVLLSGGTHTVNETGDTIYISWYSTTAATLAGGSVILQLKFNGLPGSTSITWNTQTPGNCEYADITGQVIFSSWVNGNITINQLPLIITQPVNITIYSGGISTFSVSATGTGLGYQWQVSSDNGSSWSNLANGSPYSGVTTITLTISPATTPMNGYLYRCYITGACPPYLYSAAALLTVTQAAITTTVPNVSNSCTGNLDIPVNVTNCVNVGGISLVLQYDQTKMSFEGYHDLNSELIPGILVINQLENNVYLSWASNDPADIGDGTLVYYRFRANSGISGSLNWDTQTPDNCEYSDVIGNIITSFYNSADITIVSNALMVSAGNGLTTSPGNSVQLNGTANGGVSPYTYLWSPSTWLNDPTIPNPEATPLSTITYTLSVTDDNACVGADDLRITVINDIPTVSTDTISEITYFSATGGGNVTSNSGDPVTARGVCWGIDDAPTVFDNHTVDSSGLGIFTSSLTNLSGSTTYYVRAYATNSIGTAYGNQVSFTTLMTPINLPPSIDSIPDPAPIAEDAGQQTIYLSGISDGNPEFVQNISITAVSSNTTLIPNPVVNYTPNDSTGSLSYTASTNASGNSTITVTVTDDGDNENGGLNTTITNFNVIVLPVNDPPFANAGPNQSVSSGSLVLLDGSGSFDVEGDSLSYSWTSPLGIFLSDSMAIHPSFTPPIDCSISVYTFSLIVNDGTVNSTSDEVTITVASAQSEISCHPLNLADTLISGNTSIKSLTLENEGYCNLIVTISDPVTWLIAQPASGNISPGDSLPINVHFNAEGLNAGLYNSTLTINSNDPIEPILNIPILLRVYDVLTVSASANPPDICIENSAQLLANPVGGTGNFSYSWTSDPAGFSSNLQNPFVSPATATTYHVVVYDGMAEASDSVIVTVWQDIEPDSVHDMSPANNIFDLELPIQFSWSPCSNTASYDLYIWPTNLTRPENPTVANILESYYNIEDSLITDYFYYWQVIAKNPCAESESDINVFSLDVSINLMISDVIIPDSAFSSDEIEISFEVENIGLSGTGTTQWQDDIYLSLYPVFDPATAFLVQTLLHSTPLAAGASHIDTVSITLDQYLQGSYYVFVKTDALDDLQETDENNNTERSPETIIITLHPYPDIWVRNVEAITASIVPDSSFSLGWIVENIGDAAAVGGWSQKISVVSGASRRLLGYVQNSDPLAESGIMSQSATFQIPKILGLEGDYYLEVELLPNPGLIEIPDGEMNNLALSDTDVLIEKRLFYSIPQETMNEASTTPMLCKVFRSGNKTGELSVNLYVSEFNRINVPGAVTMLSGQSGVIFYITAINNNDLEGNRELILSATASDYNEITDTLTVIDDETESLTVNISLSSLIEGDTIPVTVTREMVTDSPLTVNISTNKPQQIQIPNSIIIDAGEANTTFDLVAIEDIVPELNQDVIITAYASGFDPDTDTITIVDDDIPLVTMNLLPDSVSEAGGVYASWGKVSRVVPGDQPVTLLISASPGGQVYYPSQVTIPGGIMEKQFNIGVIDNGLLDGSRQVEISASIYLSSCGCGAPEESGGVVTSSLTILDNDGPSLSMTVDPFVVAEGLDNAGTLLISRNTGVSQQLLVSIQNSNPDEIDVPDTVLIPADQSYIEVPFNTVDDTIEDGDQVVIMTVSAEGFSNGTCWVMVTDRNLPDLVISGLQLSSDTIYVNEELPVEIQLVNNGFATAANNVAIIYYLSADQYLNTDDMLLSIIYTPYAIYANDTLTINDTIEIPQLAGEYFIIATVNENEGIHELIDFNNQSTPYPLSIRPDYNATAIVDGEVFNGNTPIIIYGFTETIDQQPVPDKEIDVYIVVSGVRREIKDTSDALGNFNVSFQPLNGEAGDFYIGACFPGQGLDEHQDEFTVTGMKYTGLPLIWDMLLGESLDSSIQIKNYSNIDLHGITMDVLSAPPGCELTFSPVTNLPGNETVTMDYVINATGLTTGTGFEQVNLKINSNEGSDYKFNAAFKCKSPTAFIKANPATFVTTMVQGQTTIEEFEIQNIGLGATGLVSIGVPEVEWMSLVCPDMIITIQPGESAKVTLRLTPTENLPLNVPITGNFAINCENANYLSVPFSIETISQETGNLSIDVVDEYTYYTDSGAHVDSAHVILRHPYSGAIIAEGITNENGVFEAEGVPEGYYTLTIEANRHQGYQNTIFIEKGHGNFKTIFLSFQAITYSWNVVPTGIGDQYKINLIVEYETNVPAPVVLINMPDTMPQLANGEYFPFLMTLTNEGLITANDVEITFPDDVEYLFTTNVDQFDILPQQAVQIPVIMELRPNKNGGKSLNCVNYTIASYKFQCGPDDQMRLAVHDIYFRGRYCYETSIPEPTIEYIDWEWNQDPTNPKLWLQPPILSANVGCNPCVAEALNCALDCIPIPSTVSCGLDLWAKGLTGGTLVSCTIDIVSDVTGAPIKCAWCTGTTLGCFINQAIGSNVSVNLTRSIEFEQIYEDMLIIDKGITAAKNWGAEYYNNDEIFTKEFFKMFNDSVSEFIDNIIPIDQITQDRLINSFEDTDISEDEILDFISYWNTTIIAWNNDIYSPTIEYPEIIDTLLLYQYKLQLDTAIQYSKSREYPSLDSLFNADIKIMDEFLYQESNSVCATVKLNFSQTLTMTREAFEGTLTVFNGHETLPLENVMLDLEIRDENGAVRNDLFQINTISLDKLTEINGTGVLNALQTGVAIIQFIPEKGAAPSLPISYSFGGTFSYLDPFTDETVTRPLFPVTLQVNPSPDLYLDYFMQRNVFGDDALTELIEPSIPAELAVMINNNGVGTARSVQLESAQPEIIENEKGLLIDFQIIGSNLEGKPRNLGLYNVNFGDIPGGHIGIGQWFFTSSLLGHFVSYEATVNHLDSYGNQDLSLVSGIEIHELTHSISVYGVLNDSINDFLVNDIPDANDYPDMLYYSNGAIADVYIADSSAIDGPITIPDTVVEMTVMPSTLGWNYTRLDDPGDGKYRIVSVTRDDQQVIPLDNIWLTYCTLPDGGEPVYENKLHFVDIFDEAESSTYTIVFEPADEDVPSVIAINGIPEDIIFISLDSVEVVFSEPIETATFTYEDMTLKRQGGSNLIDSLVSILQLNETTFRVYLTGKTALSGFYVLTVQAAGISDLYGNYGIAGKQVSWIQIFQETIPTITGPDTICEGTEGVTYITESGMTGYEWSISEGGTITDGSGTDSINVVWNTVGPQFINVIYTDAYGYTPPIPTFKNITVNARPFPTITGANSACMGTTEIIYITEPGMTAYFWDISEGGQITLGQSTDSIEVNWNTPGEQTITVNFTNSEGCSASSATILNITVFPLPEPEIAGPSTACITEGYDLNYYYSTEPGMTDYTWTISSGGSIESSTTTDTIQVAWNSPGVHTVGVSFTSPDGCDPIVPAEYTVIVDSITIPGAVIGGTFISLGSPTDTLIIEGHRGAILTWQRRNDSSPFSDIPSTAGRLKYTETPTSTGKWYYRTVVRNDSCQTENSGYTTVTVLNGPISRSWIGAIDEKWHVAGNWSPAGIPGQNDDVLIPSNAPHMPEVKIPGLSCHKITIQPGANLIIKSGITLTVNGTEISK